MFNRTYTVTGPPNTSPRVAVYNGFNACPIGSRFELKVGKEHGPFYTTERELPLAIEEVLRYAEEQFGHKNLAVEIRISGPLMEV